MKEDEFFKLDPFKKCISSFKLRACVGNNSGISPNSRDCCIIDGYIDTVELIYENIKNGTMLIDVAVYPMIFCCRHSIELALKTVIKNLLIVYKIKNKIETRDEYICSVESVCKKHDIQALYEQFVSFKDFKNEINEVLSEFVHFESCIKDYYFDIDGDSFRYTFKRNLESTNLEDIQLVDIELLHWKYEKLMDFFEYLINIFSKKLEINYTKTCTKNLSRRNIERLSVDLKDFLKLSKNEMQEEKQLLCEKYSISATEFDKALDKIKKHYVFSLNIGIENKFKDLTEEFFNKIGEIYKMYLKKKAVELPIPNKYIGISVTEINKYSPLSHEYHKFCTNIVHALTENEKKVILTFYEVILHPCDGEYICEDIDYIYDSKNDSYNDNYIGEKLGYLVESGKLREALQKCGQITYLQWLDKYTNLSN